MSPGEIAATVRDAHRRALEARNSWMSRDPRIHHLFRDVRLFGREAGTDFVATNLDAIVREAVETAACKQASLEMPVHGFGKAAIEGMTQTLRDVTGLEVRMDGGMLRLIWGEPDQGRG